MVFERKDIDKKYKWDLSAIYADEVAFNADYALAEKQIKAFRAHEKNITKSAEHLYAALNDMAETEKALTQ